jgi:hypothetical protein
MNTRQIKALQAAYLSELQAIAIYEAELEVLKSLSPSADRKRTQELCESILLEEIEHSNHFVPFLGPDFKSSIQAQLSVRVGKLLGKALALTPSRTSWRIHAWAERQAAEIYENAYSMTGLAQLQEARDQERSHAERFEALLKDSRS